VHLTKSYLAVFGLLILFALLAWIGASSESAVYDEPLHLASALSMKQLGDFRVDSEDPALFKQWLAMCEPTTTLPTDSAFWATAGREAPSQWAWAVQAIFVRPAAEAMALIDRGRAAMLLLGVLLGALIARWAWQAGGPAAGVIAAALFALDPNFLAHSPLIKNDVAAALGYAATAYALWRVGERVTPMRVIGLALAVAFALTMKFSGVLLLGIVPLALLIRAIMNVEWEGTHLPLRGGKRVRGKPPIDKSRSMAESMLPAIPSDQRRSAEQVESTEDASPLTPALSPPRRGSEGETHHLAEHAESTGGVSSLATTVSRPGRGRRVLRAVTISIVMAVIAYVGIWSVYGFRYAASPETGYSLDVSAQTAAGSPLRWIDANHLLPQSYTFGLAYTLHSTMHRKAFLLGQISTTGWWYYFPVAMAVKTPLATQAMWLLAVVIVLVKFHGWRFGERGWLAVCLLLPAAVYTYFAMRSNLNLGIRHMLPVYPLAFVAIAIALARYRKTTAVLLVLLAVESFAAYPNDIPYFNVAAGGSRGGFNVLADSNLDWGQGLKQLADWQAEHPGEKLYLSYFGTADPAAYGIDYTPVAAGYAFDPRTQMPGPPGVIAVSATHLRGLYVPESTQWFYRALRSRTPTAVLGGSIYLYDWSGTGEKRLAAK
jgi:hypothetical protein